MNTHLNPQGPGMDHLLGSFFDHLGSHYLGSMKYLGVWSVYLSHRRSFFTIFCSDFDHEDGQLFAVIRGNPMTSFGIIFGPLEWSHRDPNAMPHTIILRSFLDHKMMTE